MRRFYPCALLVLVLLLGTVSGCTIFNKRKFGSDYSYAGAFHKYRTFNFVTHASQEDSTTLRHYAVLKDYIKERLEMQGYEFTDRKPDLLVSYYLFYNDLNMKGYEQEEFDVWLANNKEPNTNNDPYRPIRLYMSQGTLLVTLLDHKKHNAVWQGYSSGVMADKDAENTTYLNRAVRTIFDQYRVFRKGYLRDHNAQMNQP